MKPGNNGGARNTASPQSQQALSPLNPSNPKPGFANEFSSITSEQPILKHVASGFVSHVGAADGPVTSECTFDMNFFEIWDFTYKIRISLIELGFHLYRYRLIFTIEWRLRC